MERVGRYRLERAIGRGGMAEVFEAVAEGEDGFRRRVAVKRVLPNGDPGGARTRMFLDEARIAAQLHHGNIVAVLDYGVVDGAPFQVLEFVDGADAARLAELGAAAGAPMPVEVALYVCAAVAHALAYAHDARDADGRALSIVHRDVSPSNVLVSWAGDVKLTDFGIALAANRTEKTADGITKGKLLYMSPEQATLAGVDARTDVFALGCTLHALVAGESPLAGEGVLMGALAGAALPLASDLPDDVRALVAKATATARARRYEDAHALAAALGRALRARLEEDPRLVAQRWLARVRPGAAPVRGALDALLDLELVLGPGPDDVRCFQSTRATQAVGPQAPARSGPLLADPTAPTANVLALGAPHLGSGGAKPRDDAADAPPPGAAPAHEHAPVENAPSARAQRVVPRVSAARRLLVPALLALLALSFAGAVLLRVGSARRSVPDPRAAPAPGGTSASVASGPPARAPELLATAPALDAAPVAPLPARLRPTPPAAPTAIAPVRHNAHAPLPRASAAPAAPAAPAVTGASTVAPAALSAAPGTDAPPAVLVVGGAGAQRGEILIDGRSRGYAPRTLTLPAGSYVLQLVLPDGRRTAAETVELSARNTPSNPLRRIYP
jgi:serine/threonine-protein kinase